MPIANLSESPDQCGCWHMLVLTSHLPPCSSDLLLSINFTQNLTFEHHSCCSVTPDSSLSCPLFYQSEQTELLARLNSFSQDASNIIDFYVHIRCEVLRFIGSKMPHAPTPFIRVCYSDAIYRSSSSIEHGSVSTHSSTGTQKLTIP
jgi:hypothetical protein